jgi:hypothetical protein
VLTASAVTANQTVTITASYTSGGVTKTDSHTVTVVNVAAGQSKFPWPMFLPAIISVGSSSVSDPG